MLFFGNIRKNLTMGAHVVIGETWCGFTKKQAEELAVMYESGSLSRDEVNMCMRDADYTAANGITFSQCAEDHADVKAFPTWKSNGAILPGYKTAEQIATMMSE